MLLWEPDICGKLPKEYDVLSAPAKGKVFSFAGTQSYTRCLCGGVHKKGRISCTNLDSISGVRVAIGMTSVGGVCCCENCDTGWKVLRVGRVGGTKVRAAFEIPKEVDLF